MGHWHWQVAEDIMSWSVQVYNIAGLEPQNSVSTLETAVAMHHEDDRTLVRDVVSGAVSSQQPFEYDARVVRPDGEIRNIIVKGQPECADGQVVALFGVVADVTDAFATITSIQDQHEMLDLAAEVAQLGHCAGARRNSVTLFKAPSRAFWSCATFSRCLPTSPMPGCWVFPDRMK